MFKPLLPSRVVFAFFLTFVSVAAAFAFGSSVEPDVRATPDFGRLLVSPGALVFPVLNYKSRKPQPGDRTKTLTIENDGRGTNLLVVTVGPISGTNAANFTLSPAPTGPISLATGRANAVEFVVTFTPTGDGRATAELPISATDTSGARGLTTRTIRLIGNALGPIPVATATPTPSPSASASASASATPTSSASSSASATATPVPQAAGTVNKNSANAPGIIITGTTVTAYIPLGSDSFTVAGVGQAVIEGPSPQPSPATYSANHVLSCSPAASGEIVCAEGNSAGVAQFDLVPAGASTAAMTMVPTSSTGSIDYLPGECSACGVLVDDTLGTSTLGLAIMSTPDGFFTLDLGNVSATPVQITTNPSEAPGDDVPGANFGYDVSNHYILNANYDVTSFTPTLQTTLPLFQIINITNPASPQVYELNNATSFFEPMTMASECSGPSNTSDNDNAYPETTAIDEVTHIAYVSFHTPPVCENTPPLPDTIALFDLSPSQTTFTPGSPGMSGTWDTNGKQIQSLSNDFALNGVDVMSIEPNNHVAILGGGPLLGAMSLPTTSGSGTPAIQDWVSATMPSDPDGTPWNGWSLPNGVQTYVSPNTSKSMALMLNALEDNSGNRTGIARYAALVDIKALLAQPRDQTGGHQVAAANDGTALITENVVTFVRVR